jgi:hypothetical protein
MFAPRVKKRSNVFVISASICCGGMPLWATTILEKNSRRSGLCPMRCIHRGSTEDRFAPADVATRTAISSYGFIAPVRTHEWNYSVVWNKDKYPGNYMPQLYELKSDPDELKSVADQQAR